MPGGLGRRPPSRLAACHSLQETSRPPRSAEAGQWCGSSGWLRRPRSCPVQCRDIGWNAPPCWRQRPAGELIPNFCLTALAADSHWTNNLQEPCWECRPVEIRSQVGLWQERNQRPSNLRTYSGGPLTLLPATAGPHCHSSPVWPHVGCGLHACGGCSHFLPALLPFQGFPAPLPPPLPWCHLAPPMMSRGSLFYGLPTCQATLGILAGCGSPFLVWN